MSFPDRYLRDGCSKSQEAERGGTPCGSTERLTCDLARLRGQSRWVSSQTLRRFHSFCAEVGAAQSDETRQEVVCRGGSHGVVARSRCSQIADAFKVTAAAVVVAERVGIGHGEQAQQADLRARHRGAAHGRTPAAAIDSSAGYSPSRSSMTWSLASPWPAGLLRSCRHAHDSRRFSLRPRWWARSSHHRTLWAPLGGHAT